MFLKFGKIYTCQRYRYDDVEIDKPAHIWQSPEVKTSLEGLHIYDSHDGDSKKIGLIDRIFTRENDLGVYGLLVFDDGVTVNEGMGLSLEYTANRVADSDGSISFSTPLFTRLALTDTPRGVSTVILDSSDENLNKYRDDVVVTDNLEHLETPDTVTIQANITELVAKVDELTVLIKDSRTYQEPVLEPIPNQKRREVFKRW